MNTEGSGLFPYGLGIVAVTKEDNVDTVMFFPAEKLSLEYGKVDEIKDEIEVEVLDSNNKKHKIKAERGAMMEARWFPDGTDGRQTAPDVVNGETIQIYRFRDSDVFYWKTILREPELRRLEHVVYAYSNLPSGRTKFELDSSYGHSWSTKDKKVTFWTSQSNGEAFSYKFKIDTAASTWSMWDNVSNGFGIESIIGQVYMRTTTGGFFEITRNIGTMSLTEGLEVETPRARFSREISAGLRIITPSLVLGRIYPEISSVPEGRMFRMSNTAARVYKQDYGGYELTKETGVVIGDDCLYEMGHQAQMELGRNSHLTMQENSKVELDFGSLIKLGEDSTVTLDQRANVEVGDQSSIVLGEQNTLKIGERANIEIGGNSDVEIKENSRVNVKSRTVITLDDDVEIWIGGRNIMSYLRNIGLG